MALAVPSERVPADLVTLVEETLDLPHGVVAVRGLAIDQLDYIIAVWPATATPHDPAALVALAERLDGELLTASSMQGVAPAA